VSAQKQEKKIFLLYPSIFSPLRIYILKVAKNNFKVLKYFFKVLKFILQLSKSK